ncbi:MAG: hypothetical protein AMJ89_00515 [candidate division Zixibacteria bacterium SM23_73]|nr:MAG: hypothetical protein AMJ89_00515 [candidate division Zixibacteria bacterium SM23_73]
MEILDDIPMHLDINEVSKKLHLAKKKGYSNTARELVELASSVIRPKVIYEVSYVGNKNEDTVDIGNVKFTSHVLRVNLDKIGKVFPYVVTIGKELEDNAASFDNLLKAYCLDEIGNMLVELGMEYLEDYLKRRYKLEQLSNISPGSLEDWPITQQKQLFSIFGNVEDLIGVKLTDSSLMIPKKSVSGIFFPTHVKFYSCQLCPRENCKERAAPYDKNLAESYRKKVSR